MGWLIYIELNAYVDGGVGFGSVSRDKRQNSKNVCAWPSGARPA